jgi:hypothetical protein
LNLAEVKLASLVRAPRGKQRQGIGPQEARIAGLRHAGEELGRFGYASGPLQGADAQHDIPSLGGIAGGEGAGDQRGKGG